MKQFGRLFPFTLIRNQTKDIETLANINIIEYVETLIYVQFFSFWRLL